jgi:ligand-binding sensor domain-containing protein
MTIVSMLVDRDRYVWIATTAGLYCGQPDSWQAATNPLPLQPTVLAQIANESGGWQLLAAGPPAGIVIDAGRTDWHTAWVDEIECPITCIVASPRFTQDRVLLAGTERAGVLRSTDSGRHWRLMNAGLDDLVVLALATPPTWEQRELIFAGTTRGLYRSPNGGRAWSLCGLSGEVVQVIAPAGTKMLAGTEQGSLYRSSDQGVTWGRCALPTQAPINALWTDSSADRIVLAGTADGELLRSTDGGERWMIAESHDAAVLALTGERSQLYAGCADDTLLVSTDLGQTWQRDRSFAVVS